MSFPFFPGFYCPRATGYVLQPCPTGTYSPNTGLAVEAECLSCVAGSYCGSLNLTSPSGPCAAGYYCKNGSDTATPSGGHKGYAGICPLGNYCPSGNSTAPVACPLGTFNNATHGKSIADCLPCLKGYFCDKRGLSWPTGQCQPGYYCNGGAIVSNPSVVTNTGGPCAAGTYCKTGTSTPFNCPAGTYNSLTKQDTCLECPPGYYCVVASTNYTECPKGYYCPNG